MAEIKKILIVCGEPSGDLLAAHLVTAIKSLAGHIEISGVGGTNLAKAGCNIFYHINQLSVMGFFDVLKKLPRFFRLKKIILDRINTDKPDCLILVDFSGFNLRLAQAVNKSLPVIYYVSPQLWASREGRIQGLKKFISLIIVLFRFEEEFYKKHYMLSHWAGHPLIDLATPQYEKTVFLDHLGLSTDNKIIALLPGSRQQEIKLILPLMLQAGQQIKKIIPATQFIIAKAPNLDMQLYQEISKASGLDLKIIDGKTYDCLNIAQVAMVCSGTATLETAILGKPFVIIYKTNLLNYLLYRPQMKIPYIGMVNIVAGKKVVPEFIQFGASAKIIAQAVIELLNNPLAAQRMGQELERVKASLGQPGASTRAAKLILDFIQNK